MVLVFLTLFRVKAITSSGKRYIWNLSVKRRRKIERFLEKASSSIRNIIYANVPNTSPEEREDIEQEVKLKIWRKIAKGEEIENLRSYLWRVVQTTALDIIAARMENRTDEELQVLLDRSHFERLKRETPEICWQIEELKMSIREAVNLLPERRKIVLQLWLLDMNIEKIAAALGWRDNQVRHLLYRGIDELKAMLNPDPARETPAKVSTRIRRTEEVE